MEEDSALRARIGALSDTELARMLTADADSYRDDALAIGREEASRRKLDLASLGQSLAPSILTARAPRKPPSLEFTRPFPFDEMPRLYWAALLFLATIGAEVLASRPEPADASWPRSLAVTLSVMSLLAYLRIVFRIHRALELATDGAYPVSPRFAVGAHFIPLFNLYWLHGWTVRVAQCAARNGEVGTAAFFLPTAVYLLGLMPGFESFGLRIGLFILAARIARDTLLRAARSR